jgi:hypothetical protein
MTPNAQAKMASPAPEKIRSFLFSFFANHPSEMKAGRKGHKQAGTVS